MAGGALAPNLDVCARRHRAVQKMRLKKAGLHFETQTAGTSILVASQTFHALISPRIDWGSSESKSRLAPSLPSSLSVTKISISVSKSSLAFP